MKRNICLLFYLFCLTISVLGQDYKNWVQQAPRLSEAYFHTDSARRVAEGLLAHQIENGAWPKNINFFRTDTIPSDTIRLHSLNEATIDNGATTTEIRFLMRLFESTGDSLYLHGAIRGIEYLLSMQYENGGFPQYYPRHDHYHGLITFNDDAMTHVMRLLLQVSRREVPYARLPLSLSVQASVAVDKGIECILACQYVQHDSLTVWAQQYDENTLTPAPARSFELAGLCSAESVGIVEFLMLVREEHPEVVPAIKAAVNWFRKNRLEDGRWARYYTLEDNRPFFCGRDGVMRFSLEEIDEERQHGYSWYNTRAVRLLQHFH